MFRATVLTGCLLLSGVCSAQATPLAESPFSAKPVRLVADDWCPQHCEQVEGYRGYIVDIVSRALELENVPFTIVYQPWLRAMKSVQRGVYDGLLTPTVEGYPHMQFVFHQRALGYQDYCFYTPKDQTWQFTEYADLHGKRLSYLKDSGFGPLSEYLIAHQADVQVYEFAGGKGFTSNIFEFLSRGRADVIIMTSDVYQFALKQGDIRDDFRSAGCLGHEKLAVGFSGAHPQRSAAIAAALDEGIRKLTVSGEMESILARYGMRPWPEVVSQSLENQ